LTVFTDLIIIGNRLGERSLTEWGQALVLLVSVVLFAYAARRRPEGSGLLHAGGWLLPVLSSSASWICCWMIGCSMAHGRRWPSRSRCW
jgi:hypothetical protein